jgi:type II secretory pathway predicted ATPase ExeA
MLTTLHNTWDLDVFFAGGSESKLFVSFVEGLEKEISSLRLTLPKLHMSLTKENLAELKQAVHSIQTIDCNLNETRAYVECLEAQSLS